MDVARLNFSHGDYDTHAAVMGNLRAISDELDTPVTILQDLQWPKIRVCKLPSGQIDLKPGDMVSLVPESDFSDTPGTIPIDYEEAAEDAKPGMQVLLADGLLEMAVTEVKEGMCCVK